MKQKYYFTIAALYHKEIEGVTAGTTQVETKEVVAPKTILAESEQAAHAALVRSLPADGVGAEAINDLGSVQLIVKRF